MGLTVTRIAAPVDQLDTGSVLNELAAIIAFRAILPARQWFVIDVVRRERNPARIGEIIDRLQELSDAFDMPSVIAHVEDSDCSLVAGLAPKAEPALMVFNPDQADDYGEPAEVVDQFSPDASRLAHWSANVGLPRLDADELDRLARREWLDAAEPVDILANQLQVQLLATPAYVELDGLLQIHDARTRIGNASYMTTETRYAWGKGDGYYGIWDRRNPGPPIQRFAADKDGYRAARRAYSTLLIELPEEERLL